MVTPGVTTKEIDGSAEALVRKAGAEPAFKGYHGYPATVCASINEQVVHGIPSARRLVEGDVLSLDMGAKLDGFFGDCAVTHSRRARVAETANVAARDGRGAVSRDRRRVGRVRACRTLARRFSSTSKRTVSRWCGNSSGTGSGLRCTRSRRSRTTGRADAGRGCRKEWFWPSSRWSTRAPQAVKVLVGRLDGSDARRQPVGAFRAHRGRHARGLRDPHAPRCGRGQGKGTDGD